MPEKKHQDFMREALALAQEALDIGEVPVGCVLVYQGKIIAKGRNNTNASLNGTRHAEFEAIDSMFLGESGMDLSIMKETDLYVTVEPCIMCAQALAYMNVRHVYYGCGNEKFGGNGSVLSLHEGNYQVTSGILANEAIMMLRKFYSQENDHGKSEVT